MNHFPIIDIQLPSPICAIITKADENEYSFKTCISTVCNIFNHELNKRMSISVKCEATYDLNIRLFELFIYDVYKSNMLDIWNDLYDYSEAVYQNQNTRLTFTNYEIDNS
jgi:hypothetical protein